MKKITMAEALVNRARAMRRESQEYRDKISAEEDAASNEVNSQHSRVYSILAGEFDALAGLLTVGESTEPTVQANSVGPYVPGIPSAPPLSMDYTRAGELSIHITDWAGCPVCGSEELSGDTVGWPFGVISIGGLQCENGHRWRPPHGKKVTIRTTR